MADYVPQRYWDDLLREHLDERGVAYPGLPVSFNRAMYVAFLRSTRRMLDDHGLVQPLRVLDIGSGTGIWIDFWLGLGRTDITGVDLTQASVDELLARYPELQFYRGDAGAPDLPVDGPFDAVSVMSVLLHITNDDRWRQAWKNIASVLASDGYAVLIEPVVVHRWWGRPFGQEAASKARPLSEYRTAIADAGLELVDMRPATVLVANPVDTRSRLTFHSMSMLWRIVGRLVRGNEDRGRHIGAFLNAFDGPLRRLLPGGPSAKILLVRRS